MDNIFRQIREERQDFLQNEIEVVPGYNFSQYNTIKKIHLYYNGHYEKGDYEEINGVLRKKVFHQMSTWRCDVSTKMIDMDIKDFTLVSNNNETDWNVYILEKELKVWFKTNEMGQILNKISRLLPIYGSVVLQKTKDGASVVDLRHLYIDQSAESLKDARYINIRKLLSHQDVRKMGKLGWENTKEAIDKFSGKFSSGYDISGVNKVSNGSNLYYEGAGTQIAQPQGAPLVEVWERYGEVPLSWFTDNESDDDEYVLAKYCVTGVDQTVKNDNGVVLEEEGLVLYKEQIDELPFKEVHYNKTEGRWLGVGVVEILFEPQRRKNEIENQIARANELASLQIFQSRDETIASNITTDLQNGEILKVKSEITPIATESRNMVALENHSSRIDEHGNDLTFSRDVVSGENAPSSATLGAVQIQTQQTTAVFDYKKENIGLFLGEFIKDLVFPQIEKELNKEHILRLTGSISELQKLRENFATNYANKKVIEAILNNEDIPDYQALFDVFKEKALDEISKFGDKIWTEVQKDFFKNLDYNVEIVSTGENSNIYAKINNGNALLQLLGADPTVITDPAKRKVLFKIMSSMGWHMSELEEIEKDASQMQQVQSEQLPELTQPQ
jgi:hypothetical protein